jgi:hypothetical protein
MNPTRTDPATPAGPAAILTTVLGGFASHIGEVLRDAHAHTGRQAPLHPGDHFARVLVWSWETDRPRAMQLLHDLLVALRTAPPGTAPPSPAYTLEDLLAGLPYALPPGFADYDPLDARRPHRCPHPVRSPRHLTTHALASST